ncbi:MAG TPA: hypothetical protein VFT28_14210, partial [Gemmatimonadales bacterium]|nr:hypothetical protein [Gemmatimonadales bacterium]
MLAAILVVLAATGLAAFTYLRFERLGRRALVPLAARALAWSALGLLLINVSCPTSRGALRPLVLLDGSLSMGAPGGRWREARDSAGRIGEIRLFGDEVPVADTTPRLGHSLLGPALTAAAASERSVVILTDGEIEDAGDLPRELLDRASIRLFPRVARGDLVLASVSGPARVTAGDTIPLELDLRALAGAGSDSLRVEVRTGNDTVAAQRVRVPTGGAARVRLSVPSAAIGPGTHALRVALTNADDSEPRTDTRIHIVTVARTPGVVLLAAPGDWDSRFLYRTLRDVAQLPVRGFVRLEGERWRTMEDLSPVSAERVRRASRGADLLILKGDPGGLAQGSAARGLWYWPSGERGSAPIPGDWYLSASEVSPVAGAFLGMPVDSFPPATQLVSLQPGAGDWVGLTAQLGRRGAARPAVIGRQEGRARVVTVGADGLWRWAFRGG